MEKVKNRRGGLNLIGSFKCNRESLFAKMNPYGVDWANIELNYNNSNWLWTARIDWHSTRVDVDGYTEEEAIDNAIKCFAEWADRVLNQEEINEHTKTNHMV